jgi:hypothetical protein
MPTPAALALPFALCLLTICPPAPAQSAARTPLLQTLDQKLETVNTSLQAGFDNLKQLFARQQEYPWRERETAAQQSHDFDTEVYPILKDKCLACHGCYDAPCQLKLENAAGLERGGSKLRVYNGLRLADAPPTRLGIDETSAEAWRRRGFFSVLDGGPDTPPLLQSMIDLGRENTLARDAAIPADLELGIKRKHACPAPGEFERYAKDNPHAGMPLALAGLSDAEYAVLSTWLAEGAALPPAKGGALSSAAQDEVDAWEEWLNRDSLRARLLSRYLYEHLYLGHLYLQGDGDAHALGFFRLVRSHTPAPQPIQPVATVRPNEPVDGEFFYRLQAITETLVHKTHITYRFDAARRRQLQALFDSQDWSVDTLPGYDADARANPFATFADIPPRLRYRFLLNDALYFVRNFIRGPVCRGQIATDVIRDQFWVMFESPTEERYTNRREYRTDVTPWLGVPGQKSSLIALGPEWLEYKSGRNRYLDRREERYARDFPEGPGLSQVWDGEDVNPSAFLTVFRHHDSASVTTGWQGEQPVTTWLMDYPLLERTYYELVVGFNVFGSVSHQAQTRLYFDLIRNEAETNFLRLLPPDARQPLYDSWYQDMGKLKVAISYHDLDTRTPTRVTVDNDDDAYGDVLRQLRQRSTRLTGAHDAINRPHNDTWHDGLTSAQRERRESLRRLAARPAAELDAVRYLPDVTFLRVDDGARSEAFTLLRNRRHSNVAFMLGESLRYQEERDSLSILPTLIGSYPNLMLRVSAAELDGLTRALEAMNSEEALREVVARWGLRRMDPAIWPTFHGFTELLREEAPLEAGVYDLNRYGRW